MLFCQRSLAFEGGSPHNLRMRVLPLLIFILMTPNAHAADLTDAVSMAVSNHPSILAAKQGLNANLQDIRAERSALYPTVNLNSTAGRIYGDNSTSRGLSVTRGAGYSWLWEGSVALNQTLYDWSARGKRIERAQILGDNAQSLLLDTMDATAYRAVQSYISVVSARDAMQLVTQQKQELEDMRSRIETAVEDGGGDESELSRADDLVLLADNAYANALAREQTANANYREAVGVDAPSHMQIPVMPGAALPDNITAAIAQALRDHPQVMAAQARHKSFVLEGGAEKAAALPRVEGQISYLKRDQRDEIGGEAVDARATVSANWDIETGGAAFARIDKASNLAAQIEAETQDLTLSLERDIRTAWAAYHLAQTQVSIQSRRVDSAESVMNTYTNQFEAAQRSLLDLMSATNQLYEAQIALLDAGYARIDSAYTILAAMGDLRDAVMLNKTAPHPHNVAKDVGPVTMSLSDAPQADQGAGEMMVDINAQDDFEPKRQPEPQIETLPVSQAVSQPVSKMSSQPRSRPVVSHLYQAKPDIQSKAARRSLPMDGLGRLP